MELAPGRSLALAGREGSCPRSLPARRFDQRNSVAASIKTSSNRVKSRRGRGRRRRAGWVPSISARFSATSSRMRRRLSRAAGRGDPSVMNPSSCPRSDPSSETTASTYRRRGVYKRVPPGCLRAYRLRLARALSCTTHSPTSRCRLYSLARSGGAVVLHHPVGAPAAGRTAPARHPARARPAGPRASCGYRHATAADDVLTESRDNLESFKIAIGPMLRETVHPCDEKNRKPRTRHPTRSCWRQSPAGQSTF